MSDSLSREQHSAVARAFIDAINAGDYPRLREVLAPDVVRHCMATPEVRVTSAEDFEAFDRDTRASFPDQHLTIHRVVAEEDGAAVLATFSGTQEGALGPFPPTGRRVECRLLGMFRFEGGQIAEMWVEWDNIAFLSQLGHFPPPSP